MITLGVPGTTVWRRLGLGLLAGLVLGTAGCASAAGSAPGRPVPSTVSHASTPSPAGHPLGERVPADNALVEATVYAYQQPAAQDAAPPQLGGYVWAAADIQACASGTSVFTVSVSSAPWLLGYRDGSQIAPAKVSDPHFPQPAYPAVQTSLNPGQCVRGWIVFAVPGGTQPASVRYAPHGADPVDWATS